MGGEESDEKFVTASNTDVGVADGMTRLDYVHLATADNTRKAYRHDVKLFIEWGGSLPCSTEDIVRYLESHANQHKASTLERRLAALSCWHVSQEEPDPTKHLLVRKTLKGIRRSQGVKPKQAKAITLDELTRMVRWLNTKDDLISVRNKALVLVNFFGAFRASELLSLTVADIKSTSKGIIITLPNSKTDQEGRGQQVVIPFVQSVLCAATALNTWLAKARIHYGPVFRRVNKGAKLGNKTMISSSLNDIYRKLARESGMREWGKISSHSFRRGMATEASRKGANLPQIMKQGRWRSMATVMGYIDDGQCFDDSIVTNLLA